jgi:hypothetical protein
MESKLFSNFKITNFQNINVSTKLWKALVILPLTLECVKKDKLSVKSMWLIRCILN